jgi:V-type H+-transporting ATPase subunit d
MNIEIIRNTLYKAYLEDFYAYCQSLGSPTSEVMGRILQVGFLARSRGKPSLTL